MITTAHREQQCIGTVMQLPTMKEVLFLYLSCVNQGIVLSTTLLIEKTEITCFKPYYGEIWDRIYGARVFCDKSRKPHGKV